MQRKFSPQTACLSGRNKSDREFIYLHMSNHYRRIVNAKKTIDNSPPLAYKGKRPATSNPGIARPKLNRNYENILLTDRSLSTNSNKDSSWGAESFTGGSRYHARCVPEPPANCSSPKLNSELELLDRIACDNKHGPAVYCGKLWEKLKEYQIDRRCVNGPGVKAELKPLTFPKRSFSTAGNAERTQKRKFPSQKTLKPSEVPAKAKSVPSVKDKVSSKVLKTVVVSKLRSLRVYHPPRRIELRVKTDITRHQGNPTQLDDPRYKCTKMCICDGNETVLKEMSLNPKEQSITSSRDSAYNGGISSDPETRTPTPDQRRKGKECCCSCCEKTQRRTPDAPMKVAPAPVDRPPVSRPGTSSRKSQDRDMSYEKLHEDELYLAFVQDITTEVLERNLYTNKALKKVMKKHLQANMKKLNKDRMLQELENLRVKLGIPEDQTLFDPCVNGSDSVIDVCKFSVISDSEFVMPCPPCPPCPPEQKLPACDDIPKCPEEIKCIVRIKCPEETSKPPDNLYPEEPKPLEKVKSIERAKSLEKARTPQKKTPDRAKPPQEKPRAQEKKAPAKPTDKPKSSPKTYPKPDSGRGAPMTQMPREVPPRSAGETENEMAGAMIAVACISSDESDRPSDPKKRSVLKNNRRPKVPAKRYAMTSSESDLSECYSKTGFEEPQDEYCPPPYYNDPSRAMYGPPQGENMSYWKNANMCNDHHEIFIPDECRGHGQGPMIVGHQRTVTKKE